MAESVSKAKTKDVMLAIDFVDKIEEIKKLPVKNPDGDVVPLSRLASISFEQEKVQSYHLFQGQESLVITVHKQANAKMTELTPLVYDAVELFKKEYTEADFDLTQDQSSLLNAGISNLSTSLIYGGVFAFAVLFLFMGNYRLAIIMGITLPVSLIISFLLFYAFCHQSASYKSSLMPWASLPSIKAHFLFFTK